MRTLISITLGVLTFLFGCCGLFTATTCHAAVGPHGGSVVDQGPYRFEVVFTAVGLDVYPTREGQPFDVSKLSGSATFFAPASTQPWFSQPLQVVAVPPGQTSSALTVVIDLGKATAQGVTVAFQVQGLPDETMSSAAFNVPYGLTEPQTEALSVAPSTADDASAIAAQKVCPVSGGKLGGMGTPLKVTRGDRTIFLCCKGCLPKVKADPDKYLASAVPTVQPSSSAGAHVDENPQSEPQTP